MMVIVGASGPGGVVHGRVKRVLRLLARPVGGCGGDGDATGGWVHLYAPGGIVQGRGCGRPPPAVLALRAEGTPFAARLLWTRARCRGCSFGLGRSFGLGCDLGRRRRGWKRGRPAVQPSSNVPQPFILFTVELLLSDHCRVHANRAHHHVAVGGGLLGGRRGGGLLVEGDGCGRTR